MPTDHIIALLTAERDKINQAIKALQGPTSSSPTPVASAPAAEPKTRKKRKALTAAQRKAHALRMKGYWANRKKA